ncbi:hypothetical protein ACET3X_005942 [Alternaria dauci]|uniref:Uncharacterized protein n=1 Tax=Alternaria dauci TaxID=48095 RepID=A0ABR3UI75_9PLEO
MGNTYRTPSPTREPYISSSNVNSPQTAQQAYASRSDKHASYQQYIKARMSELPAVESDEQHQQQTAALLHLQNVCPTGGGCVDQILDGDTTTPDSKPFHESALVREPQTPRKKRVPVLWHGLPSPGTPTFCSDTHHTPSAGPAKEELIGQDTREQTKDAIDQLPILMQHCTDATKTEAEDVKTETPQTIEDATRNDAILARELEASLHSTKARRSNRLRTQMKPTSVLNQDTVQVPVAASKTTRELPPSPVTPDHDGQANLNAVPIKSDVVPFEGLPTVHSLSWQLQYPPGGSTHPSYPYPALDPRLLFHQAFVPIIGGLPDFTLVPKLVLPMGWKHVSWSGLFPIAFDPYRQAFKLTPVGPMPLTCEELHQQGLQKYVPGGELHPEFGLLPEMLKLSDGSDAEVYNFDGVDWTLPWEGQMDFHAPRHLMNKSYGSDEIKSATDSSTFIPIITYPWREGRDCPNKVFDLSDAWRWLSNKETNHAADFVPTPEKKWHGSGAFRSTRKLKSPIPELMMLSMQSTPTTPNIQLSPLLQNQDSMKDKNQFCPLKSVATPCTVDITLLEDTEFTIVELLSYFPQHYYWGHAAERMAKAGVTGSMIRDFIIMTRGLQGDEIVKANRISCAAMAARKKDCGKLEEVEEMDIDEVGKDTPTPTPTPAHKSTVIDTTTSYTAEGWVYDVWEKIDYPLLALAHGLQSLPTGPDAGPLTALILWCKEKGRYKTLLSEVPGLLKTAEIEPLIEPGEKGCPDREATGRHAGALKQDRLRVVRDAGVNKRALGGGVDDTQGKRRKIG